MATSGCFENRVDCARMQAFFTGNGWPVMADFEEAGIILFNACELNSLAVVPHRRLHKEKGRASWNWKVLWACCQ